jgi:Carboxypeptidase regulatory-like domain/TonB dependent receptor-like, beta-barrel
MCDALSSSLPRFSYLLILILSLATTASAQFRAGIQGAVTDPQGAAVVGATVTLNNKETNRTQETKSGAEGFYRFDRLSPGIYTITVEMTGFKKKVLEVVNIQAEEVQGVNVTLEAGDVSETITVTDATERLDTENANVDRSISTEEVLRLPQVGRDPYELVRLTPGVFGLGARNGDGNSIRLPNTTGPGGSNSSIFQTENQVPISSNGQRLQANNFELDGVSVNSQAWGGAAVLTPNQESVKELRVVANSYSSEFGRNTGTLIQVVSQNGTNEFHGSAFFKYNDPSLNAFNKWGGPTGGSPKRVQNRFRQFGGSIGGPVYFPRFGEGGPAAWNGKNKLFFFFSWERLRNNSNNFDNRWVETPEFRQLLRDQRPSSLAAGIVNLPGMEARVDNVIPNTCAVALSSLIEGVNCRRLPDGRLDLGSPTGAIGQRVSDRVGGGFDGIPDIQWSQITRPGRNTAQQFNGRVDFQATSSDLIAFSFYWTPNDNLSSNERGRPVLEFLSARRNTAGALVWNHTFSPTILNEARFNVTRWYFDEFGSNPNLPWGIPYTEVSEVLPTVGWGVSGAGVFYQTTYNFRDVLSKVVGSHGLKFGGEISKEQNNDTVAWAARPSYFFGSLWNFANDAPIRETGHFDPRTGIPTDLKKYIRASTYSLFAQDDWKVRPNLTLNLGLRWEYWQPLKEKFGNLSKLVLGQGQNIISDARFVVGESLHEPDRNNFGPQLGFAWSPARLENKAVLRGGFGIGYNRIPYSLTLNGRLNPPFVGAFTLTSPGDILYGLGSDLTSPGGYPSNPRTILQFDPNTGIPTTGAAPNVDLATFDDVPNSYVYRYSLDLQYEFGADWLASLGFQGSTGHKLTRVVNYRLFSQANLVRPNNNLNVVRVMHTDVNSNFNALIARVSKRFSKGFHLNAQYRWSKSIDTCSDEQNCVDVLTFPFDQSTERSPSDFDVTHVFTASGLWDLPIFRGRRDFVGKALGGWQLNGILTASSGFPWTPVFDPGNCSTLRNNGFQCPQRPAAYLGGLEQDRSNEAFQRPGGTFGPGAAQSFISPSFMAIPPQIPGIGRNVFRGPNYFSVDMSAIKRIGLPRFFGESAGLDIRANLINVFNNLNLKPFEFNTDSTRVNHVNFGRATEALSGRVVEFQARFFF